MVSVTNLKSFVTNVAIMKKSWFFSWWFIFRKTATVVDTTCCVYDVTRSAKTRSCSRSLVDSCVWLYAFCYLSPASRWVDDSCYCTSVSIVRFGWFWTIWIHYWNLKKNEYFIIYFLWQYGFRYYYTRISLIGIRALKSTFVEWTFFTTSGSAVKKHWLLPIGLGSDGSIKFIVDLCPLLPEAFEPLFTSSTREITLAVGGEDCCVCCWIKGLFKLLFLSPPVPIVILGTEEVLMPQIEADTGIRVRKAAGGGTMLVLLVLIVSPPPAVDVTVAAGDFICWNMLVEAEFIGDLIPSKWTLFPGFTVVSKPPPPTVSLVFCMASKMISSTFCGDGFSDNKLDLCWGKGNKLLALKGNDVGFESLLGFDPVTTIPLEKLVAFLMFTKGELESVLLLGLKGVSSFLNKLPFKLLFMLDIPTGDEVRKEAFPVSALLNKEPVADPSSSLSSPFSSSEEEEDVADDSSSRSSCLFCI